MILYIKLFSTLKEKAQANKLVLEISGEQTTVGGMLTEITAQKPYLGASMKSVLVAVNKEYAFSEQIIQAGDEIAMFPPVSGG